MVAGRTISALTTCTTRAARRITAISFTITKTIKNPSNILTTTSFTGKITFFHLLNRCPYVEDTGAILAFIGIIGHRDIFLFLSI
jgi:hypothetical protein